MPKVKRTCEQCGKGFMVWPSRVKHDGAKFCSRDCANQSQIVGTTYECVVCSKKVVAPPSVASVKKTCSRQCMSKHRSRRQRGSKSHRWKGGVIELEGYIAVMKPDHPRAWSTGYVLKHILVAEEMLGRHLVWKGLDHPDTEVVHHINGDRKDNRPSNLEVLSPGEHSALHHRLRAEEAG